MANPNPLQVSVENVYIEKFNGTDKLSILPQFVELIIYQSLFEPTIKAEMLINDQISLFSNYPLIGEETVTITYKQVLKGTDTESKEIKFIIKAVRDIAITNQARSMVYVVDLISPHYLQNSRKYVSHAYSDVIENMAEQVFNEYISIDTALKFKLSKPFIKEPSSRIRTMVIPNLRPFQAIQWLAKNAVASDFENKFLFLFYEDIDQFNFVTIQKLIEDAQAKRKELQANKYTYTSSNVIETTDGNNPDALGSRSITNIVYNKRFSTIEKIASGYYQNELFEISLLQKSYNSTLTELDAEKNDKHTLEKYPLNTAGYVNYVKNLKENTETSNRIRYMINNYEDVDDEGRSQPQYRLKFGNAVKYLNAINQVDITITVPGNMSLKVGDVIYCDLPEAHGFNENRSEFYISGLFLIVEIKQVIAQGNLAATSLRIYKDGYLNKIEADMNYGGGRR